jgi:omega-amidase
MRIALAQMICHVGDPGQNTKKMLRFIDEAKQSSCDLIVFPEMSDTGYSMPDIVRTASPWTEGPVVALREAAKKRQINIVAGISEREGDAVFNAIAVIDRNGSLTTKYRKTHLITAEPVFEQRHLRAGEELVIGRIDKIAAGLMTCYDVRFPEIARALTLAGAEVIIVPAAFPLVRIEHWKILTQARAIENQVFVIAVDRVGTDGPGLTFGGASQVIDPSGVLVVAGSETEEKLLFADCDLTQIERARTTLKIQQDRRPDLYAKPVKIAAA